VSVELRALAGPSIELFGPFVTSYRAQPEILMSLVPEVGLKLVAGGGLGSAYVMSIDPRDFGRAPAVGDEPVRLTMSGVVGAHFRWQRAPVAALLRTEAVGGAGWATTLNLGLGLPGAK
jgi:hypothetical protein